MAAISLKLLGDSRSLERAFLRGGRAGRRFNQQMVGTGRATGSLRRSFSTVTPLLLGGAGIAAGLTNSVKSAANFDREMRNVNSIAGLSEKQLAAVRTSVLSLATTVGQGPDVLARGLYDLASSGFRADDAVKILAVSSKAATAGLTDTATSSKAIAAALNAYHLSADQAGKVSDILFQTVNKGVITFEELSQNMGDLVPAAAPLGVKLEEVGAAIATLTLQGVPAAEAATRVKNAMLLLAKPANGLNKLLRAQGFASGEAAVKALGFSGVLELISKKTKGSVTATAALAPEIRALLGVVGLTGKNLPTYTANLAAMSTAQSGAGATARAFAEQSRSAGVKFQKFGALLKVVQIQVGNALLPAVLKMVGAMSKWLSKTANQKALMDGFKSAVAGVAAVFKALVSIFQTLNGLTGSTKNTIILLGSVLLAVKAIGILASGIAHPYLLTFTLVAIGAAAVAAKILSLQKMQLDAEGRTLAPDAKVKSSLGTKLALEVEAMRAAGKTGAQIIATLRKKLGGSLIADDLIADALKLSRTLGSFDPTKARNEERGEKVAALRARNAVTEDKKATDTVVNALKPLTAKMIEQRNNWFDAMIGRKLNRVQDISGETDQISALGKIAAQIRARIAATKDVTRKLSLEDQLLDVVRQQRGLRAEKAEKDKSAREEAVARRKELAEAAKTARIAQQFRTLGLTAEGGERTPGKANLKKQLGSLAQNVKGTILDTGKTRSMLARIRKVLSEGIVPDDVRAKIAEMLAGLRDQLRDGPKKAATQFKKANSDAILAGLGLSPEQMKVARFRLAQLGAGGTVPGARTAAFAGAGGGVPVVVHTSVNLDGQVVGKSVTTHQQKAAKRRATSRRGPSAGR